LSLGMKRTEMRNRVPQSGTSSPKVISKSQNEFAEIAIKADKLHNLTDF